MFTGRVVVYDDLADVEPLPVPEGRWPCLTCGGQWEISCIECADGDAICPTCEGGEFEVCTDELCGLGEYDGCGCDGDGTLDCRTCNGAGMVVCEHCAGTGMVDCPSVCWTVNPAEVAA